MEAEEFLNQKRIGLVNKFYYQVFEIKKITKFLRLKRTGENQIYPCY